jgi:hypothetical protein
MASRKKSKSRRKFLINSEAAAICPAAIALGSSSISVSPEFPTPRFGIGEAVAPNGDKKELHTSQAVVIGVAYNPEGTFEDGWWYLLRWVYIPGSPRLQGRSDDCFWHETQLRTLS